MTVFWAAASAAVAAASVWCATDDGLPRRGKAAAAAAALAFGAALHPALPLAAAGVWTIARASKQNRRAARRRRAFSDLPEFFELLSLCLSGGQGMAPAWSAAAGNLAEGPLRDDVASATRALALGRAPAVVMRKLAERIDEPRAAMSLSLVAQAMVRGNPAEPVLLSQAAALRRLKMLDVERRAQTAPLRMMAPVFIFIFPAVLILMLAPIFLSLGRSGALF